MWQGYLFNALTSLYEDDGTDNRRAEDGGTWSSELPDADGV